MCAEDSHDGPWAQVAERVAIGLVLRDRAAVLVGRRARPPFEGCAEFPGGKAHPGERLTDAVRREVLEETGLTVDVGSRLARTCAAYPRALLDLHFFLCRETRQSAVPPRPPFRWMPLQSLAGLVFPPANAEALRRLVEVALGSGSGCQLQAPDARDDQQDAG